MLGAKSNLILSVISYTPSVHCSSPSTPSPDEAYCAIITNEMYATTDTQVFGPIGQPGVDALLPKTFSLPFTRGRSCAVVINSRGPLDTANWFEMWAGARAIAGICLRKGVGGISTGQGRWICDYCDLSLMLTGVDFRQPWECVCYSESMGSGSSKCMTRKTLAILPRRI